MPAENPGRASASELASTRRPRPKRPGARVDGEAETAQAREAAAPARAGWTLAGSGPVERASQPAVSGTCRPLSPAPLCSGSFLVCSRCHSGASAGSRPCGSRGAARARPAFGALCPPRLRAPLTPSEGDRKRRRRVALCPMPGPRTPSPPFLRVPSLVPFSDCQVGLSDLFLRPVGKDKKRSRRRGSKE